LKRVLFILLAAAIAIGAVAYGLRMLQKSSARSVASLLPRETIAFAHVPDFNRTHDEWRRSDIYRLFHEPDVQEFLRKPLTQLRTSDAASQTLRDLEQLGARDIFFAITSIDAHNGAFVAGFRFRADRAKTASIIDDWRVRLLGQNTSAKQKITYRQHEIEIAAAPAFSLATVYDGQWFFASNEVENIKQLLDRAEKRAQDRQSTLQSDKAYGAAMAHMPSDYAVLFYVQPKPIAEKLASIGAAFGRQTVSNRYAPLRRINSICGTTRFERGKIHDIVFAGIDQMPTLPSVTRSSLFLGTSDTFFYLTTLIDPKNWSAVGPAASVPPLAMWPGKFLQVLANNGVTAEEWNSAFTSELSALADWSPSAHWPSFLLTVPVKEPNRANRIASVITTAIDEDGHWSKSEKDGVTYFSLQTPVRLFALTPTIAVSDRLLVAGLDPLSVETAIKRTSGSAGFSNSQGYRAAARALPTPTNFFSYIDTTLLYSRLDSTLRPMLLLGAAFLPAIANGVDLDKFPPPQTVTKHLSPIVSSQRYERDGYVAESLGPVTLNQAALALAAAAIYSAAARPPQLRP
jgi:hypothetical protein